MDELKHVSSDATFDDIQYRITIREKLELGLKAIEDRDFATPEEVEAELSRWEKA